MQLSNNKCFSWLFVVFNAVFKNLNYVFFKIFFMIHISIEFLCDSLENM